MVTPQKMRDAWSRLIYAATILGTLLLTMAYGQSTTPKEAALTQHATGPFDVKLTPQDDNLGDGLSRMVLEKQYHGDLVGTAKGQMLAAGSAKSSGVYVAIETFTGTLRGKSGSFVLHHTGIMSGGAPTLTISLAPGSGTGDLQGITGNMKINIAPDGKHSYDLEYTLPPAQ